MAGRQPETIATWQDKKVVLELGPDGKFIGKASGWDENRVFLKGDKLQIEVRGKSWVLTHLPAGPPAPPEPPQHYFPEE